MLKKDRRYMILSGRENDLENKVNEYIDKGYIPVGNVTFDPTYEYQLFQAVYLPNNIPLEKK